MTFDVVELTPQDQIKVRSLSKPLIACVGLIAAAGILTASIANRSEIKPERAYFSAFPRSIGEWQSKPDTLGDEVLKTLDLTDYLLADFTKPTTVAPVNFYVAYYESQRKGSSPHSPTVCLPGGGWQIVNMSRQTYPGTDTRQPFQFNRVLIRKGNSSQLVYYWFEERGRVMADEYQVKWYLFRDALLDNRTDGALVRVISPIVNDEPVEAADQRINAFLAGALPLLPSYVPN